MSVPDHPNSKKKNKSGLNGISYISFCSHCLLSYQGAPVRRACLDAQVTIFPQVFKQIDKVCPVPFLLQVKQSQLSASSCTADTPLLQAAGPAQYAHVLLELGCTELDMLLQLQSNIIPLYSNSQYMFSYARTMSLRLIYGGSTYDHTLLHLINAVTIKLLSQ